MSKVLFFVISALTLASLSAQARISNELATVKASQNAISNSVDLNTVYDASVQDSGKTLTVEIKYKDSNADCTMRSWFDYAGAKTVCEECQGNSNCACSYSMCNSTSNGSSSKPVVDYIYTE